MDSSVADARASFPAGPAFLLPPPPRDAASCRDQRIPGGERNARTAGRAGADDHQAGAEAAADHQRGHQPRSGWCCGPGSSWPPRTVSRATVGRVLADAHVRPHKVRGWLNRADDPRFWIQAGQACRLYLHPEPGTVLISVDEKTGIQAKTRRHPGIPAARARDARREFEYVRHGTVSIIAAINVATGEVISQRIRRNNSVTFTGFLSMLDQHIAPHLRIRLVMDNGSSHTSKATRAWIAAHPWKWKYDADAEHARYLQRHPGKASVTQAA